MKASEFVGEFGLDGAKKLLGMLDKAFVPDDMIVNVINGMWVKSSVGFTKRDLKRLVESHDLVGEHGSIESVKQYADSKYTASEAVEILTSEYKELTKGDNDD